MDWDKTAITHIFELAVAVRVPANRNKLFSDNTNTKIQTWCWPESQSVHALTSGWLVWRCPAGRRGQTTGRPAGQAPRSPAGRLTGCPARGAAGGSETIGDDGRCDGWRGWSSQRVSERVLTRPAMGVGSLLIFLTKPGLIVLSSLRGRGERRRGGFIESPSSIYALRVAADPAQNRMRVFVCISVWAWVGAYSHNRMPFSSPLRKSLSPKLFPVTAWEQRAGRGWCKGCGRTSWTP